MTTSPVRRGVLHISAAACALLLLTRAGLNAGPQAPAAAPTESTLAISGDVTRPLTLTPAELKAMARTTVSIVDQGREVKYTGVLVGEVLARAGALLGRELSGAAVA